MFRSFLADGFSRAASKIIAGLVMAAAASVHAQGKGALNLVSRLDPHSSTQALAKIAHDEEGSGFSGVWGSGNLAVMGTAKAGDRPQNPVYIMDIANPAKPTILMEWAPNATNCNGVCETWAGEPLTEAPDGSTGNLLDYMDLHDAKVKDGYGYFASNGGGNCQQGSGFYIVDLRAPGTSYFGKVLAHITDAKRYYWPGRGVSKKIAFHTFDLVKIGSREYVFLSGNYDSEAAGYVKPLGSATCTDAGKLVEEIRVYDITTKNSPIFIKAIPTRGWTHDISFLTHHVRGKDRTFLFASDYSDKGCNGEANQGCTEIIDVTDPANAATFKTFNSGPWTHSSAPTDDGRYLHVTHEILVPSPAGKLEVYEIYLDNAATPVSKRFTYVPADFGLDNRVNVHEAYVRGNFLFTTWYESGAAVFNIKNPLAPVLVGAYDTFSDNPQTIMASGGLDIHPFLGDDRILVSDTKYGFHVMSLAFEGKVSTGEAHTMGVKSDGTLWAWGRNGSGQFGDGATSGTALLTPKRIGTANNWISVSTGLDFSLGLRSDGTLWAWGANGSGQLGDGTRNPSLAPKEVPRQGTLRWAAAAASGLHVLALRSDGALYAWGYNGYGQVGNGSTADVLSPTPVICGPSQCVFSAVKAGTTHSFGLTRDRTLWAWGNNSRGQTGEINLGGNNLSPIQIPTGVGDWTSIAAGHEHTVALSGNRSIYGMGWNALGQLAQPSSVTQSPVMVRERGASSEWGAVSAGQWHTGGIRRDGSLWTWGYNNNGQLGNATGPAGDQYLPVRELTNSSQWAYPYLGMTSSLARRRDGWLWGWGRNSDGQLAVGNTNSIVYSPTRTRWSANGMNAVLLSPTAITDLSAKGKLEWVHWGRNLVSDVTRRTGAPATIGNYTKLGTGTVSRFTHSSLYLDWGTPTSTATIRTYAGLRISGVGSGFQIAMPATSIPRLLRLYVGVNKARGKLELTLSDGSSPAVVNNQLNNNATTVNGEYNIVFSSMTPGATMTVKWTMETSYGGDISLRAAALSY